MLGHLLVHRRDHALHGQVRRQWFSEVEMNAAFFARNTAGNRGHIFKLCLDILIAGGKLGRLQRVAGIDLVRNHQWGNIELREHRLWRFTPRSGQGEHFDYRGLGEVTTVLCPALAVRDPDWVSSTANRVADILG